MTLTTRRDEPRTYTPPDSMLVLAAAIDRLAQALEQLVLSRLDGGALHESGLAQLEPLEIAQDSYPTPPPPIAPLALCPVHNAPWKYVPAGTSKRTGRPFDSFYACPVMGCTQRPPA